MNRERLSITADLLVSHELELGEIGVLRKR